MPFDSHQPVYRKKLPAVRGSKAVKGLRNMNLSATYEYSTALTPREVNIKMQRHI